MTVSDPAGQTARVIQLRKTDAPPLFDEPAPDTDVLQLVEAPALVPVDAPGTARSAGGWRADRAARMQAAPAIVPTWLRRQDEFTDAARFVATYYAHVGAFHATRSPVYLTRLVGKAPRGGGRLAVRWFHWVTDSQAAPVWSATASRGEGLAWAQLVTVQSRRTGARRKQSFMVAVPVGVLVVLAVLLLPTWALTVAGTGIAALLGVAGRDPDRPIVHRYVSIHVQRRLESPEVEAALEAIGIKGRVDWPNPIAVDGPGWRAEIDLPGAYTADEVLEKRPKLAAAMRRPLATVWPETDPDAHPGRLVLWIARQDPSKAPRRLWPLLRTGQADLYGNVPFGFDPRGRLVELELTGANVLIGGVMGSGKTSAVLTLVLAGALDPTCEMWVYELKGPGDLDSVQPVCHRYVSGDDDEDCKAALDALRALKKELKRRKAVIAALPVEDVPNGRKASRKLADRKDLGLHPLLAVFDEVHTLFEHETYGKEAAKHAADLIRKARAYGIVVVLTTQRPDAESIPKRVSANAILRFCLAVTGHTENNLVLGTGAYARGIRATMFDPRKDAGTGWLARSALDAQIVRAAFITQEEARQIGCRALAVRTAAGTLTGQAAGQTIADTDDSDLLDHVRAVWPDGQETCHSHRLVEALAAYRPDLYGEWTSGDQSAQSTMLSTALKPYGVQTRQINRRGDGGSAKGVRFEDLPDRGDGLDDDPDDD
jgi:S-DNA-T family DNA segregation ATPase FtsK/SpoIIIE